MVGEGSSSSRGRRAGDIDHRLTDMVFSWSVEDIYNQCLYQSQVEKIPDRFSSVQQYLGSFVYPLLEETRAELCSSMESISTLPYARVTNLKEMKPYGKNFYEVRVDFWRNDSSKQRKEPYKMLPNDLIILAESKPETLSDLQRTGGAWAFASVTKISADEDITPLRFKLVTGRKLDDINLTHKQLFVVSTINLTTTRRIWSCLHMTSNWRIMKEILPTDSLADEECGFCPSSSDVCSENLRRNMMNNLNDCQAEAVITCLRKTRCQVRPHIELIWGPPGTGKTKATAMMLLRLLQTKCRTVVCAPTNVAIVEVASRVVQLMRGSACLVEVLLFGSKERLKVEDSDVKEIYLDNRIGCIVEFDALLTRCKHDISRAINFLVKPHEGFFSQCDATEFEESLSTVNDLEKCLSTLCTHSCADYFLKHEVHNIIEHLGKVKSFSTSLLRKSLNLFSGGPKEDNSLDLKRCKCLAALKLVRDSLHQLKLPCSTSKDEIKKFCFQSATLIFCTVSSTFKLHSVNMEPPKLLVIEEAAQLKESESVIPLQLPGLEHAILIGDERQLPSVVKSDVSGGAHFDRSLFERLSSLGKFKHTLDVQYRMHPSISCFPSRKFYSGLIRNGPNVMCESYTKQYLREPMFGSYSFINISDGREDREDNGLSMRNLVEADVAAHILSNLYQVWSLSSKEKLSVGIISPYAAQIRAIDERLGKKYENSGDFTVSVNTVDGFQGKEEDIIILSTVRSNNWGSIGFLANPNRTNVALTRARYALWILGNQRTLRGSSTEWESLLYDAMNRRCFFNAEDDSGLAKTILEAKKEYNQLDDLLAGGSLLSRNARWKVLFSENFRQSFRKLTSRRTKSSVMNLVVKLASGWRPRRNVDLTCEISSQIVKQFKAENLYVLCTVDIEKELNYIQILKIWNVLPVGDIMETVKRIDGVYTTFSDEYISRCKTTSFEGDLQVPVSWQTPFDFLREAESSSANASDSEKYTDHSKVKESLLLMKFYSLSSGTYNHLLTDGDGNEVELPFEVTNEQREIIQFQQTTFLLGRSGTGKTTVLTLKLLQREQLHHIANTDYRTVQGPREDDPEKTPEEVEHHALRQLFVTVSPKLCSAVKQQLSELKSFTCGGEFSSPDSDFFTNGAGQFEDIPDSFVDIPLNWFPLVITFSKLLMVLDGSIGVSYFERFSQLKDVCHKKHGPARSLALQAFIREKEVKFEKFCESYWPHFNTKLIRSLDPSRVFTEIISHIKGRLHVGGSPNGRLSRTDYVSLSEGRASNMTRSERDNVYDVFLEYEKKKLESGEFDLSDFVNDLHSRLQCGKMKGYMMDFVYVDEVQDLTMRQVALFKYLSQNVEEGFVFSGDTAQTIGRGVDFKFEDVRLLFYKEFMQDGGHRGKLSKTFQLSQNFRAHDGILKLAHSIIELLRHFFPLLFDALSPETSQICGDAPVFLELGKDRKSILSIFGDEGLGTEQVVLVRDDCARQEVLECVVEQSQVLTINECKGLEFQDLVLYDFFGSSPVKNQWRVLYDYMKGRNMLSSNFVDGYPQFNPVRHNILCSELKQLYVAITRARQRLWICEDSDQQFSKPMLDYWRHLGLIQGKSDMAV